MANDITIPKNIVVPAYLQQYKPAPEALAEYAVPGADPIAILSLKGKAFTIRYKGEKHPCLDAQGMRGQYVDLIIAMANPAITKTWWEGGFDEANPTSPDCFSFDGVKPEPTSPNIQSPTCKRCKWDVFGSRGKGKACKDGKKVAVLQLDDIQGEQFGGPQLLRIPPDSFNGFRKYNDELLLNGLWAHAVVTRIWFDTDAIFRINFQFVRCIDEEEAGWVEAWRTHPDYAPITDRILSLPEFGVEEDITSVETAPAPQPKQVQATAPAPDQRPRPVNAAQPPQQQPKPQPVTPPVRPQPAAAPVRPAQAVRPVPPAQAAPQRPRQAPPAQAAAPARPVPPSAAGAPSRAPQRPVPAGNGSAGPQRPAPVRPAAPPAAARPAPVRPAPVRPAPPVQEELGYEDDGTYNVDAAVSGVATSDLMSGLDDPPGVPGD